jgi:hypothetical protein
MVKNLQDEPAKKLLSEGYKLVQGNLDDVNSLISVCFFSFSPSLFLILFFLNL